MNRINTRKLCMLGDFAVGKTSLARRFVEQRFSDRYLTTVGVKIDTKTVELDDGRPMKLLIWDIAGSEQLDRLRRSYIRGLHGYLLVCDSTRLPTLTSAKSAYQWIESELGSLPCCLLVNKTDLIDQREIDQKHIEQAFGNRIQVLRTSAKSGAHVDQAFRSLAHQMRHDG